MADLTGWDVERYRALLRAQATKLRIDPRVRVRVDESDLVQKTFERACDPATAPCRGESDGERLQWLLAIERNLLFDAYDFEQARRRDARRDRREQDLRALADALDDSTVAWEGVLPPAAGPPPSEVAARREELDRLTLLLDRLPPREREVMLLRHREGLGIAAIAERLNLTEGAVSGLLRRATERLADISTS
jgi:RNA polymerase sigma-70 factor (ECF subfamily)